MEKPVIKRRSKKELKVKDELAVFDGRSISPTLPENEAEDEMLTYILKSANSPQKIRLAYTLTYDDIETTSGIPRPSYNFAEQSQTQKISSTVPQSFNFCDALTDQVLQMSTGSILKTAAENCSLPPTSTSSSTFRHSKNNLNFSKHRKFLEQPGVVTPLNTSMLKNAKTRKNFKVIENNLDSTSNKAELILFANATTSGLLAEKTSQFWIDCGDFSLSLDINYIDSVRLRFLYEIFSQASNVLHFGIDGNKLSVHGPLVIDSISKRIPSPKGCSHHWFSTGDICILFCGKYLLPSKIQRFSRLIKETTAETGILRFGVDDFEFSNVPKGRCRFAWPPTKPVIRADLDQSNHKAVKFESNKHGRLSYSDSGSNYFKLVGNDKFSKQRNSLTVPNVEKYFGIRKNKTLDKIVEENIKQQPQKKQQYTTAGADKLYSSKILPVLPDSHTTTLFVQFLFELAFILTLSDLARTLSFFLTAIVVISLTYLLSFIVSLLNI